MGGWLVCVLLITLPAICQSQSQSVPNCPEKCLCFEREIGMIVRCMFLGLTEIPEVPPEATILDLRFNRISSLSPDSFKGLRSLYTLLLNSNELTEIGPNTFAGLNQLKYLYLYKNKISKISPQAFTGLPNLEQLYIHMNALESLHPQTFSQLPLLQRLFLQSNKLTMLPQGVFDNLDKLRRLRLDSNALICDCDMMWLKEMTAHSDMEVAATCAFPQKAEGKFIANVPNADFECSPPSFVESPKDISVKVGHRIYLNCQATGSPNPEITWFKDSNEIEPNELDGGDSRYSVLEDGTLMIDSAQMNDQGSYKCTANNAAGESKSDSATVTVQDAIVQPEFTERPLPVRLSAGRSTTFRCRAAGQPEPVITWTKSDVLEPGTTLITGGDNSTADSFSSLPQSRRFSVRSSGSLIISRVEVEDSGVYRCTASTPTGSIHALATLRVNQRPTFTQRPQPSTVVSQGDTALLRCDGTGDPTPSIQWLKNDHRWKSILRNNARPSRLSPGRFGYINVTNSINGGRVALEQGGTILRITNAQPGDSGYYQCRLVNRLGLVRATARVLVQPQTPPTLVALPSRATSLSAAIDEDVELPCRAEGVPTPLVRWLKDGQTINSSAATVAVLDEDDDNNASERKYRLSDDGTLFVRMTSAADEGTYVCEASNSAGVARRAVSLQLEGHSYPGDKFVGEAIRKATDEVNGVINQTLRDFADKSRPLTPAALLALVKFPSSSAQNIARSADIYERTLDIVLQKVQEGYKFLVNHTNFNVRNILSPTQIREISEVSGCQRFREPIECRDLCFHKKYRTADGTCNNLRHTMWGASLVPFRRWLPPSYENNFNTPIGWDVTKLYSGHHMPSARLVSTRLLKASPRSTRRHTDLTHFVMQWGQYLDHDITLTPMSLSDARFSDGQRCNETCSNEAPCFPIPTPPGDTRLSRRACVGVTRSAAACGSGATSVFFDRVATREQLNDITAYIDASNVYGSELEFSRHLRDLDTAGELKTGLRTPYGTRLLPFNVDSPVDCQRDPAKRHIPCFLAGDLRANEQLGLLSVHTVFMREHNRVARRLRALNPHWDGDTVYHEARKISGAVSQRITFDSWLPSVLGPRGMEQLGSYEGYNPSADAGVMNAFATAAFRFGHTLINPRLYRFDERMRELVPNPTGFGAGGNSVTSGEGALPSPGHLPLHEAFFAPWRLVEEGGVDPILRGLFGIGVKTPDEDNVFNEELVERLFQQAHAVALDLAALNVQRGRDHGLPPYNEWRVKCGLRSASRFGDLRREIPDSRLRAKLAEVYGDPANIDLFTGGMLEKKVEGSLVGPTFMCIIVEQFRRLRDGDRFYYENPGVFSPEQLTAIKQTSLARIICDNGDNMTHVPLDVFRLGEFPRDYVKCTSSKLRVVNLEPWAECCRGCSRSGDFTSLLHTSQTGGRQRRSAPSLASSLDLPADASMSEAYSMESLGIPELTEPSHSLQNSSKLVLQQREFGNSPEMLRAAVQKATTDERIEGLESIVKQMSKVIENLNRKVSELEDNLQRRSSLKEG